MGPAKPVIPKRLRGDSIVESLCEIRFTSDDLSEIVIGRLADAAPWRQWAKERLPNADIPLDLRKLHPNLRFTPTLALKGEGRIVRVGEYLLSLHVAPRYCGWDQWRPELQAAVDLLFNLLKNVNVSRIGLRYINALTLERHKVEGVGTLEISAMAAGEALKEDMNLNFKKQVDDKTVVLTRIATRSFVEGKLAPEVTVVLDVDVFTPEFVSFGDAGNAMSWIDAAHEHEKRTFFSLIPEKIVAELVVE